MAVHQAPEARDPGRTPARDEAASWLDEHGDALYRYARARVGRRDLAEDLVQDTFVAALQSHARYQGSSSVRTWLLSILKHKVVDHYRRLAAAAPSIDLAPGEGPDPIRGRFFGPDGLWRRAVASWKTPDQAFEEREFREVLDGCLGRLPRTLAAVFLLRELEGLEMAELRRSLDLSEGNIRVRLHRARLLLRECLEHRWFAVRLRPPGGSP
jgi:RNA polymerase sigma-70 factor (ECF subfamily)